MKAPAPGLLLALVTPLFLVTACGWEREVAEEEDAGRPYTAQLRPLNSHLENVDPVGQATVVMREDGHVRFRVEVDRIPPAIPHMQHLHAFTDGRPGQLPDASADANRDGFVDLLEISRFAGETLIPWHAQPTSMNIAADSYPEAGVDGSYIYEVTVKLDDLEAALRKAHGIESFDPTKYTILLHGVPEEADLPDSVASLPGVPAHATLPIAIGKLEYRE